MHYTGPVVRPPHEIGSVLLEVTVGCTHNSCKFCTFYKGVPFRMAPLKDIEADLKEVSSFKPDAKRVYALGGDPFTMSTEKLKVLGSLIKKYLPQANIATYARVSSIFSKSVAQLKELRALGFNDLVIGIESGDDKVLKEMNKGYTSSDILEQCLKLEEAGINYYTIYLSGLAGHDEGKRNAENTANILNKLHPSHMYVTSVAVLPDSKLYQEVLEGKFKEASELERIEEILTLIKNLKNPITLYGQSIANPVNFIAKLPQEKEKIIKELEKTILSFTKEDEKNLRLYRESLRNV